MSEIDRLAAVIERLRARDGCPWDSVQTHESIKAMCIEEAAEVICGINILTQTGDAENLKEELGDLLFQVLFHASLAQEEGLFTLEDVAKTAADKMVRRHPHLFGGEKSGEHAAWEEIKRAEKAGREWQEPYLRTALKEAKELIEVAERRKGFRKGYKMAENTNKMDYELALEAVRERTDFVPKVGIVLGSGLGGLADDIEVVTRIPYSELEGFPRSTVEGHKGEYIFGYIDSVPVVLMNGRVHYYEGYPMQKVVLPVRVMALLGVEVIILTNAAGGLNKDFHPGTLMCINDQNTAFVPSPLIGPNDSRLGVRFPDVSAIYDKDLQALLHKTADDLGIELADGVYLQITGPAYETPNEVAMYAMLGADAVGMSTGCEGGALKHMGMRIMGITCITDMAIVNTTFETSHEEIQKVANRAGKELQKLVKEVVRRIGA